MFCVCFNIYIYYIYIYVYIYIIYINIYIYIFVYIYKYYIYPLCYFPDCCREKKSSTVSDQIFQSLKKLPFMYFNKLAL